MIRIITRENASSFFVTNAARASDVEVTFCSSTCVYHDLPEAATVVMPGPSRQDVFALYEGYVWRNVGRIARGPRRVEAGLRPVERSVLLRRIQTAELSGVCKIVQACACGYVVSQVEGQALIDDSSRPVWHRLLYPAPANPLVEEGGWLDVAHIIVGAAVGLNELHQLAIACQTPYPHNVVITPDGLTRWVDLDNLAELDDQRHALDVFGFVLYCVGPWLLRLKQLPGHVPDALGAILAGVPVPEVLPRLAELFRGSDLNQKEWIDVDPATLWISFQNVLKRRDALGEVARAWAWVAAPQRIASFVGGEWAGEDLLLSLHGGQRLAGLKAGRQPGAAVFRAIGGQPGREPYRRHTDSDGAIRHLRRNLELVTAREIAARAELVRIHQSIGWRFILSVYAFQRAFTPPGSLRFQLAVSLAKLLGLGEPAPASVSTGPAVRTVPTEEPPSADQDELTRRMEGLRQSIRHQRYRFGGSPEGPEPQ